MDIIIDKNLRRLRGERGNTQEELAAFLTVSPQAVSKWERGESFPDISMLPRLALYYDVSVDDLLGVGELRKNERIAEYEQKSGLLRRDGHIEEDLKLWREAQAEFPNEIRVLDGLMYTLYNMGNECDLDEVIALAERILRESTDQSSRGGAVQILTFVYSQKGDTEKAKEYALMSPGIWCCSDILLTHVLKGDELKNKCYENLLDYLDLIGYALIGLCSDKNYARYAQLHEIYLKLLDIYFDDGFYGFYANRAVMRHHWLARINIRNEESCREHLMAAERYAKQYDGLSGKYTYTSTLMNGYKGSMDNTAKSHKETETALLKKWLADAHFDPVREKAWFKALDARLSGRKSD